MYLLVKVLNIIYIPLKSKYNIQYRLKKIADFTFGKINFRFVSSVLACHSPLSSPFGSLDYKLFDHNNPYRINIALHTKQTTLGRLCVIPSKMSLKRSYPAS